MPAVNANRIPRQEESTIYQGRPWEPVVVRFKAADGTYEAIGCQARIVTDRVSLGGEVVATCDVTATTDEGWAVTVDAAGTRALPSVQLYAEVMVQRTGEEWKTVIFYTLTVEPEMTIPIVSIAVTGDNSIAVGEITSLVATATYDDASTEDVTAQCVWTNSISAHAVVEYGNGYVHGVDAGFSTITAAIGSVTGTRVVTVA